MLTNRLYSGASPADVAAALAPLVDFQDAPLALDEMKALLTTRLLPHLMRYDQPVFQSMFNAIPDAGARLGAELVLAWNQGVTNWQVSPGGAMLEEMCCRSLCRLFGLGPDADATFLYAGTYANQEAVYLALHRYATNQGVDLAQNGLAGYADPKRLALVTSQDAHFSVRQAVRLLGLGEESLVLVPVDANRRMDAGALHHIVRALGGTRDIFCIIATAGTTATGAIDPIVPLVDVAHAHDAWLHIDGAYGYGYKLVPGWAHHFAGDTEADSITWDPHKQMGVPIPNSLLFVRNGADFGRISTYSGYFNRAEDVEPNPGLKSLPSTRPMQALPLITALRTRGLEAVRAQLDSHLKAIHKLADYLADQPDIELCHRPDTGILCFRMRPEGLTHADVHQLQRRLYDRVMTSGERSISLTTLDGIHALRLVVVSHKTTATHLLATVAHLRTRAAEYLSLRKRDGDSSSFLNS